MPGELQPWFSGWPTLDRFRRDMDELFDRFFGDVGYRRPTSWMAGPAIESHFKDGNWVMRVDLPGVGPKDIDIEITGDTLTVQAKRERLSADNKQNSSAHEASYVSFERSVTLPQGAKRDQIRASYQHGVLELTMPASPELTGRKISVEIGHEEKGRIEHKAA